jgi:hypothetical protein
MLLPKPANRKHICPFSELDFLNTVITIQACFPVVNRDESHPKGDSKMISPFKAKK